MLRILIFLCLGTTLCNCDNEYFRQDYKYINTQKAFYKAHRVKQSFSDAVATCNAEGSELIFPSSAEEWKTIIEKIASTEMDHFWIAAHDIFNEGDFITLDGTSIDELYINWGAGEPNNVGDGENCVIIGRDGINNDVSCNDLRFFVCKRLLKGLTRNDECETYDEDYKFVSNLDSCYKFHKLPANWRDAFKICKAEESELVQINSQAEADYLVEELSKYPEYGLKSNFEKRHIHVGFNDIIYSGTYLTINGKLLSESGYEKWAPSQPDNFQGNEHCGSMLRNGDLADANCKLRAMYICEKVLSNPYITKTQNIPKLPDESK